MQGISFLFFALFSIGTSVEPTSVLRWTCNEVQWPTPPTVTAEGFKGSAEAQCAFETETDGDYAKLAAAYVANLKEKGQIHAGPSDSEFESIPASLFDATLVIQQEGLESIRATTYIATDGEGRFTMAALSKSIEASGMAANILKLDNIVRVKRAANPHQHQLTISVYSHVKKPGIVGDAAFKKTVMEKTARSIRAKEKGILETVASSL